MLAEVAHAIDRVATYEYPAKPVALMRVALGGAAFIRGIAAIPLLMPLTEGNLLRFPWYTWMPEPGTALVGAILATWILSATTFTVGASSRASGAILSTALAASIALDQQAYSNHMLLLTILTGLFALTNPGAALSIDAKYRGQAATSVPGWPLFLMKVQITTVYLFAGATKLNDTYLSGGVLFAWMGSGVITPPESLLVSRILAPLALLSIVTELLIGYTLWRKPFRKAGVFLGLGLHASIALLMGPTVQFTVFSMIMTSSYFLFMADPLEVRSGAKLISVEPDDSAEHKRVGHDEAGRTAA